MTEKRFWILNTLTKCSGIKDKDKLLTFDEVVDLLNELNDENEQLKEALIELKEIGDYQYARIKELSDENEQLKKENKELKDLLKSMADRNNEIWLDNGQIIRLKKVFKGEWTK